MSEYPKIISWFCVIYCSVVISVMAQPNLKPITGIHQPAYLMRLANDSVNNQTVDSIARAQDSLIKVISLPFFDDFVKGTLLSSFRYWAHDGGIMIPDTNLWLNNSGVYLNNHLGFQHPSAFVASFDGTDRFGRPYNFASSTAKGKADSLVSLKIDLSHLHADTGAALTFWFQPQGYAYDAPDAGTANDSGDSLSLYVRTKSGWRLVWQTNGTNLQPFTKVYIPLKDTVFFHRDFQIKFQNQARLSGIYDFWHLDRVMIYDRRDSVRSPVDFFRSTLDLSFYERMSPPLHTFRSVPMEHFKAQATFNPDGTLLTHPLLADSVSALVNNNSDKNYAAAIGSIFSAITLRSVTAQKIELINAPNGQILKTQGVKTIGSNGLVSQENQNFTLSPFDSLRFVTSNQDLWRGLTLSDSMILEMRMSFDFAESADLFRRDSVSAFRVNDTLRQYIALTDYYAYDDGTAEYGFGINAPAGKLAYQFVIPKADTLTAIDIYFPQLETDLVNARKNFYISVWKNINLTDARLDSRIVRRPFVSVSYSPYINQFVRIPLRDSIVLADTFYIGFEEPSFGIYNQLLIGYDVHTKYGNKAYYNTAGRWIQVTFPGSLMMRPVFGKTSFRVQTGLQDDNTHKVWLYPNPTRDVVFVEAEDGVVSKVQVFDMTNRLLKTFENANPVTQIDLSELPRGVYIVKVYEGSYIITKKIILK